MLLDVIDGLLIVGQFLLVLAIVVAEVARVQHIVLQRVVVVGQGLQVMRTDEPPFIILVGHGILNVLQVVIGRQIELIRRRDIVVNKLRSILNKTESLVRVILLA